MSSPTIYKEVINGHLTVTRPRRGYVEVLVYASAEPAKDEEPVGEWEMPNQWRYDLAYAAKVAERQTEFDNEGDSA